MDVKALIRRIGRRAGLCAIAGVAAFTIGATTASALELATREARSANDDPPEYAIKSELADESLLIAVSRVNGRMVAVGQWGHVLISEDGGESWTQAESVATRTLLTGVDCVNETHCWAVGHDATILGTTDGGKTWERQYFNPDAETPLLTILFEDEKHGIAAGAFSFMLETDDGGKTWEERPLLEEEPDDFYRPHLNKLFRGGGKRIWIAAEAGHFFRSDNMGRTWELIMTPYEGSFWGGAALSDGSVLAVGMRGNVYRTTDMGETWVPSETGTDQSLSGTVEMDDGKVVIVGLGGAVLYSEDYGKTFTAHIRPARTGISDVAVGKDGNLILFGENGIEHEAPVPPTS